MSSTRPLLRPGPSGRRIARNAAVQMAGDVISKLATFVFYVALARTLGPDGLGDFTFAVSLAVLCVGFIDLGTDPIVTRTVARRVEAIHELYWNAIGIKAVLGCIGVGVAIAAVVLGNYDNTERWTVGILAMAILVEVLTQTPYAVFEGISDLKPVAVGLALQRLIMAGAGITALALGANVLTVAVIYFLAAAATLAYTMGAVATKVSWPRLNVSRGQARGLVVASLPIALTFLFGTILARAGVTLLSAYKGNDAVGLFGAGFRLLEGTYFVSWAFIGALTATMATAGPETRPTLGRTIEIGLKALTGSLIPITVALLLFASTVTPTLFGEGFSPAASSTAWIAPSVWLYGVGLLATSALIAQDRVRMLPLIVALAAAVNVGLAVLLIPDYSDSGAAIALTAGLAIQAAGGVALIAGFASGISAPRILLGPFLGAGAMGLVRVVGGTELYVLAGALVAYVAVFVMIERLVFPDDLSAIKRAVRRETNADAMA